MINPDTFRAHLDRLVQIEMDAIDTALVEKDTARRQIAETRLEAFREVLWFFDDLAAACDHEWVMRMTDMPDGKEKPGSTSCRKCGAVGTEIIASGTTEIEHQDPRPSEEDLFRLSQGAASKGATDSGDVRDQHIKTGHIGEPPNSGSG